jgi:hypothetical protein
MTCQRSTTARSSQSGQTKTLSDPIHVGRNRAQAIGETGGLLSSCAESHSTRWMCACGDNDGCQSSGQRA